MDIVYKVYMQEARRTYFGIGFIHKRSTLAYKRSVGTFFHLCLSLCISEHVTHI